VAYTIISMLAIQSLFHSSCDLQMVQAAYTKDMFPGMALRLEQKTLDSLKRAMKNFLPHYFNADINFPKNYEFDFGLPIKMFTYHAHWTNIQYSKAELDIEDVKIKLVKNYETPLLKVDLPVMKKWEISANQEINSYLLPHKSFVQLIFRNFDISMDLNFELDNNGYLDPRVYDLKIKFGDSYFYHENWILKIAMHQIIYYSIIILENSGYFAGKWIFKQMGGPMLDNYLNHY
jgi:hypothetical protein